MAARLFVALILACRLAACAYAADVANGTSFGPKQVIVATGSAFGAVADVDGDGAMDLITHDWARQIAWHRNTDGLGHFGEAVAIAGGGCGDQFALAAADLNGDGRPDVISCHKGAVAWWRNENGTFEAPPVTIGGPLASSIVAVDVDGDGDLDVVNFPRGGAASWYENDGNGTFSLPSSAEIGSEPAGADFLERRIAVADLNNDGHEDVVQLFYLANRLEAVICMNNGTGNFTVTSTFIAGGPSIFQDLATADVDGDGDVDIALSSFGSTDSIVAFPNTGNGTFGAARALFSEDSAYSLAFADFDGDGDRDLIVGDDIVRWLANNGTGTFAATATSILGSSYAPRAILTADLDGDLDSDVIVFSHNRDVSWFRNLHSCTFCDQQKRLADACAGADPPCTVSSAARSSDGLRISFRAELPHALSPGAAGLVAALGHGDGNVTLPLIRTVGVRAHDGDAPAGWYYCGDLRMSLAGSVVGTAPPQLSTFNVSCALPADAVDGALGAGLRLALVGQGSRPAGSPVFTLFSAGPAYSSPAPAVLPRTLRRSPTDSGAVVLRYSVFTPQDVYFDAYNIGTDVRRVRAAAVAVTGGSAGSPCAVRSLTPVKGSVVANAVTVRCTTQRMAGESVHFRVYYGGQPATGSDTYEVVAGPVVSSVRGCAFDTDDGGTAGCSTEGNDTLTVRGTAFGPPDEHAMNKTRLLHVTVGDGAACALLRHNDTTIECTSPPGTGTLRSVVVTSELGSTAAVALSPPRPLVSYAQPEITAVSSSDCVQTAGSAVRVEDCPRNGSIVLTVTGRNFGASGVEVRVGVLECANATVSAPRDHTADTRRVECTLAPALQLVRSLAIEVVQRNGRCGAGGGRAALSFKQCEPGTHQDADSGACEPCLRNEFQPQSGQRACSGCQHGSYKRGTDAADDGSSCERCPDGADCEYKKPAASLAGWWLYEENGTRRVRSLPCAVEGRCLAASECTGSASSLPDDVAHVSCCGAGRVEAARNPMCGKCAGAGMSEWGGECVRCERVNALLVTGSLAGGVALLLALERVTQLSSGATLKILVAFAQTLYAFFSADASSPVSAGGALLSLSPLDLPKSCAAPASDLTKAVLPLVQVLTLVALLAALLLGNVAHWAATRRGSSPFKRSHFLRVLTAVGVFAYIPTLRVASRLLQCDDVDGERRLRQYPTVLCSGAAYGSWLLGSWALAGALLVAGCAFVALYGQRRYREYARGEGGRAASKFAEERFGFVFRSYRATGPLAAAAASWEAVVLLRSTVFVVVATLVDDWHSRFSLLVCVAFAGLLLQAAARPYASDADNALETAGLVVIVFIGVINCTSWHSDAAFELTTAALFYGFLLVSLVIVARRLWRSERFADLRARAGRTVSASLSSNSSRSGSRAAERLERASSFCGRLWCWYHAEHRRSRASKSRVRGVDDAPLLEM